MSDGTKIDATNFLTALRSLQSALENYPNKTRFSDSFGANAAPLNRADLEYMASNLYEKFDIDWTFADSEHAQRQFDDLGPKIQFATENLVPNLHSSPQTSEALVGMLYAIDLQISSLLTPAVVDQLATLPIETRREIKQAQRRFQHARESIGEIEEKVKSINDAYSSAKNLPTTLYDLEVAASDIDNSRSAVLRYEIEAKKRAEEAELAQKKVEEVLAQANQMMMRVNSTFRAATSEGLAREFRKKAMWLNASVAIWVIVLGISLWVTSYIGADRFPQILASMATTSEGGATKWGLIFAQMLISVLSLGAPVWLAWVATKQIGERFRLAEDYAYKAALSSAYEGYRTEAAGLDPVFQAQLFSIALSRLDEIPLRLIDKHVAGSPMHELLKSPEFRAAVEKTPGLREVILGVVARMRGGKALDGSHDKVADVEAGIDK